jgi:hypothetical protein
MRRALLERLQSASVGWRCAAAAAYRLGSTTPVSYA